VPAEASDTSVVRDVLAAAVEALGGQERAGQVEMAAAVSRAFVDDTHLLVQAGTGTGKSLGYLVPALLHDSRVVVATATLALQHQLVERDIPRLVEAVGKLPGVDASYAVLKGRSNYACLHRIREGVPDDQGTLVDVPEGSLGAEVLKLRAWAEKESESGGTGEKDNAPRHHDRVWRQVSVNHRECLGATKCPFAQECFAERAKEKAHRSHLIVTNHSLLAIDAIEGVPMIPEYDAVVIDEAHEVVSRVTQAATDELAVADVERAATRAQRYVDGDEADRLAEAADALADAMAAAPAGRFDAVPEQLAEALGSVRDAARALVSAFPREGAEADADAAKTQARGLVQEVFVNAERMASNADADVLWMSEAAEIGTRRIPARLYVAPLQVWGPMRDKLLADKTAVFTSATLMLGGDFRTVATSVGLKPSEQVTAPVVEEPRQPVVEEPAQQASRNHDTRQPVVEEPAQQASRNHDTRPWRGLDVGSPFDYPQQAILYVARHLPQPGRDGLGEKQLDEIVRLVDAADGRTLGLFSSRRAADRAAEAVRERLPHLTTLAQGDAQLPELTRQFVEDPHTCLFGTLSLWQGLDVPGETCQLVIIDRIPFPRPDDPLMSARAKAADAEGRNGFMEVSATHAALLIAQGAGRLIRTTTDRGVVAVLDPRLVTARYGNFIKASLPPMWTTTDPAIAEQALKRLAAG
jgi:ATP-dependent DNA helicase DinG